MSDEETRRDREPRPDRRKQEQDFEQERRALRELIEKFRREPERDNGGFYRNVGRFIVRTMMKPQ